MNVDVAYAKIAAAAALAEPRFMGKASLAPIHHGLAALAHMSATYRGRGFAAGYFSGVASGFSQYMDESFPRIVHTGLVTASYCLRQDEGGEVSDEMITSLVDCLEALGATESLPDRSPA